jgi:hypothetical protein
MPEYNGRHKEGWVHVAWKLKVCQSVTVDQLQTRFWKISWKNGPLIGGNLGECIEDKPDCRTVGTVHPLEVISNGLPGVHDD